MTYIPVIPQPQVPPPSPRTRELNDLLSKVVDEYTRAHPATTKAEIRAAFHLAQVSGGGNSTAVALSLGLGLGVAFLVLGLFYFRTAGDIAIGPNLPMIIGVTVVLLGILAVFKARSG